MFIQNSTHQHTIYKKTPTLMLLLMESDGVTNSSQKLLQSRAPHLHILCITVAVAAAAEIARDARVYAVVEHCAADTKSCRPRPPLLCGPPP